MKTIRKSFSARLSLQVVMIASMVFGVVFSVLFFSSKRIVRQEAESHAGSELSGTVYQIEDILHQVEAAAKNMEWLVRDRLGNPDSLYAVTRMMMRTNPHVIGSCVAFEPGFYAEKGELFAPYSWAMRPTTITRRSGMPPPNASTATIGANPILTRVGETV